MTDIIVGIIILVIIGSAVGYIIKAKKSGVKCIGCPAGSECSKKSCGGCSCGCQSDPE